MQKIQIVWLLSTLFFILSNPHDSHVGTYQKLVIIMLLLFVIGKYYIRALLSQDILEGIQNLLQVSVPETVLVEFNSLQLAILPKKKNHCNSQRKVVNSDRGDGIYSLMEELKSEIRRTDHLCYPSQSISNRCSISIFGSKSTTVHTLIDSPSPFFRLELLQCFSTN